MNEITVIVSSRQNVGKSTIAHQITESLRSIGLNVTIEDEPHVNGWKDMQNKRIDAISAKGLSIKVVTTNASRFDSD